MTRTISKPAGEWLRSEPLRMSTEGTDREAEVLRGTNVIQAGPINDDRPWTVDETTLQQVRDMINEAGKRGQKGRFTHPNESNDGLGRYLGRWRNARIEADKVRADLHLSPRSHDSPEGDLGTYVLNMAESDPDMLGLSISFKRDRKEMAKTEDEETGEQKLRLEELHAVDVVDDPAATRGGMFGRLSTTDAPDVWATRALDHYFSGADRDVVEQRTTQFFDRYLKNRFGDSSMSQTKEGKAATDNVKKDDQQASQPADAEGKQGTAAPSIQAGASSGTGDKEPAKQEPAAGTLERVDDGAIEEAKRAERSRIRELHALATNAGLKDPEGAANRWVDAGLSISEAKIQVADEMCKQNQLTRGDSSTDSDAGGGSPSEKKFRAEYRENAAEFKKAGVSEEDYVLSRKIDEGEEELLPAGVAEDE